ncbi:hypothetical protein EV401DRAFT_787892 [Pisolithus croceorrhizus]|nr:hypothetical protein EV401DRAFT_787892 [Pisolithus croceorrhizus]
MAHTISLPWLVYVLLQSGVQNDKPTRPASRSIQSPQAQLYPYLPRDIFLEGKLFIDILCIIELHLELLDIFYHVMNADMARF